MKKKNVFKWWGVVLLLCMCSVHLPNKVSEKFNRSETFSDIDAEFRLEDAQESLFQNAA